MQGTVDLGRLLNNRPGQLSLKQLYASALHGEATRADSQAGASTSAQVLLIHLYDQQERYQHLQSASSEPVVSPANSAATALTAVLC